ncbi:hypothetical protein MVEG_03074 [Podila verticillata NRRL 6337]|nr:hypothetical protein MVEG_03074 [Podila verticillata NRRL 6337]
MITTNGSEALAEALKALKTKLNSDHFGLEQELSRSKWRNSIGVNGGQVLAKALKTNSVLSTLELSSNTIGENGGQALAEALKTNSTLATLSLAGNSI